MTENMVWPLVKANEFQMPHHKNMAILTFLRRHFGIFRNFVVDNIASYVHYTRYIIFSYLNIVLRAILSSARNFKCFIFLKKIERIQSNIFPSVT